MALWQLSVFYFLRIDLVCFFCSVPFAWYALVPVSGRTAGERRSGGQVGLRCVVVVGVLSQNPQQEETVLNVTTEIASGIVERNEFSRCFGRRWWWCSGR